VNETGEEEWISNEENGSVVPNHIPVALLSVELDGEAPETVLKISYVLKNRGTIVQNYNIRELFKKKKHLIYHPLVIYIYCFKLNFIQVLLVQYDSTPNWVSFRY
jgi:hypothetical protein